jgi:hypothetical protein
MMSAKNIVSLIDSPMSDPLCPLFLRPIEVERPVFCVGQWKLGIHNAVR